MLVNSTRAPKSGQKASTGNVARTAWVRQVRRVGASSDCGAWSALRSAHPFCESSAPREAMAGPPTVGTRSCGWRRRRLHASGSPRARHAAPRPPSTPTHRTRASHRIASPRVQCTRRTPMLTRPTRPLQPAYRRARWSAACPSLTRPTIRRPGRPPHAPSHAPCLPRLATPCNWLTGGPGGALHAQHVERDAELELWRVDGGVCVHERLGGVGRAEELQRRRAEHAVAQHRRGVDAGVDDGHVLQPHLKRRRAQGEAAAR